MADATKTGSELGEVSDAQQPDVSDAEPTPYVLDPNAIDISPEKDGGIMKVVLRAGSSDDCPHCGDTVYVHYVGTLASNGKKFDSSRDNGEKFEFTLGKEAVIKGWDIGVATMHRGELAILQCTAPYAYGERGSPPSIPPHATLVFEVELFDWKGEDISEKKDGSIIKSIVTEGEGYKKPREMSKVSIHLTGRHNGRVFQDEDIQFVVGEVFDGAVISGIEQTVQQMKLNEKAKVNIKAVHAYGPAGNTRFEIPENADVEYDIELKVLIDLKDSWQLDNPEKFTEAEAAKTRGTEFFKEGRHAVAEKYYKRIIDMLGAEDQMAGEEGERRVALCLAAHLNSAMCRLKLNANEDAIEACNEALKYDAKNEKGLFRRGTAHLALRNYEEASRDFHAVLAVDPTNKAARKELAVATAALKEIKEREKKKYGGMFEKFALADEKREKANAPIHVWKDNKENVDRAAQGEGVEVEDDKQDEAVVPESESKVETIAEA